jgi:hypothetical protein
VKRVIRLSESDLESIVRRVISEQNGFEIIKGSTSSEPIRGNVLNNYGLPVNEKNSNSIWELVGWGDSIVPTFTKTKNLSLFKPVERRNEPRDFIEFIVYPQVKGGAAKKLRLDEKGTLKANIYYKENGVLWRVLKVRGSGNGLLALGRALKTDSTPNFPNQIIITMGSKTRESSMFSWDPNKINSIQTALNTVVRLIAASILTKSNLQSQDSIFKKYVGLSNQDISKKIVEVIKSLDNKFSNGSYDRSKLGEIDMTPIVSYLDSLPKISINDLKKDENYFQSVYGKKMDPFFQFVVNEYKKRVSTFLKDVSPDNYTQLISSVNPKGNMSIGNSIIRHLSGPKYGQMDPPTSATRTSTRGEYEIGK